MTRGRKPKWTTEAIEAEVRTLIDRGRTYAEIKKSHSGMLTRIEKLYGGFAELCEVLDIDLSRVFSKVGYTKYLASKRSKEDLDNKIKELFRSNYPLVDEIESWVVSKARVIYGDWHSALRANGVKPFKAHTDDINSMSDEIIKEYSRGLSGRQVADSLGISSSSVYRVLRDFEVEADGYRYCLTTGKIYESKESVQEYLRNLLPLAKKERVSNRFIKEDNAHQYYSIKHHFNTISEGFLSLGEYLLDSKVPIKWSDDFLLDQIRLGFTLGKPLNTSYAMEYMSSAVTYARKRFGTWSNAIDTSGVGFDSVRLDAGTAQEYGFRFESLLSSYFEEAGVAVSRYAHVHYRPDFVVGDVWLDAKLSQNTVCVRDKKGRTTLDKYEPHCDSLVIVFLRGDARYEKRISEKTTLVSVYKILKNDKVGQKYAKLFTQLEEEFDEVRGAV